ncbi:twitching motility protein PilT [Clostridiales bacterium PH28_bin88]|nr:twitching motility protein PilT [Clostridiales bacterium PH28_bin88]
MKILVDTNILIDHLRGIPEASRYLAGIEDGNMEGAISVLTVMELYAAPKLGPENIEKISRLLEIFHVIVPVDLFIAQTAGKLIAMYQKSHGLEPVDALIAATAIRSDAVLLTRNEKHFKYIPNLLVVNPLK